MQLKEFIKKAYEHRIDVSGKRFWIGVLLMIISWQLIALGISTHVLPMNSWLARFVDFSVQMFLATFALFLLSTINGLIQRQGLKGYQLLKITRENEVIKDGQARHLSYGGRVGAIYARAALAISSYFLIELARVFIGAIDNSTLHGADAVVYALMFGWWVDQKVSGMKAYTRSQWTGMLISASAILFAFIYESFANNPTLALGGVAEGLGSAIMLAPVILISSIVVYHDSVMRIAFHNCLFGFVASSIVIIFIIYIGYDGKFSEIMNVLDILNFKSTLLVSITYALALLGFLQSYKFIESILIAMLGNSLGLGTMLMTFFFNGKDLSYKNLFLTIVLIIGSIILGVEEWRKDTNEKKDKTIR